MTLICNTPPTIQTVAEPMIEQQISLLDRALQSKLILVTHASQRETLRSESVRKEIPTYTDSIYRPPPKPTDIPKLPQILLDLETDLNKDHPHTGKFS